ncbi:MAG: hypothetical protein EON54_03415 [Alcaligenaceae bacterium]|nr:MAG: hypothetical protein EON54_03415 [Alcaligenaceae bacterium]
MKAFKNYFHRLLIATGFKQPEAEPKAYHRHQDLHFETAIVEKLIRHGQSVAVEPVKAPPPERRLKFDFVPKSQANRNVRSYLEFQFAERNPELFREFTNFF